MTLREHWPQDAHKATRPSLPRCRTVALFIGPLCLRSYGPSRTSRSPIAAAASIAVAIVCAALWRRDADARNELARLRKTLFGIQRERDHYRSVRPARPHKLAPAPLLSSPRVSEDRRPSLSPSPSGHSASYPGPQSFSSPLRGVPGCRCGGRGLRVLERALLRPTFQCRSPSARGPHAQMRLLRRN
jgi:hypothetical protein